MRKRGGRAAGEKSDGWLATLADPGWYESAGHDGGEAVGEAECCAGIFCGRGRWRRAEG